jgi:hypothetical protein
VDKENKLLGNSIEFNVVQPSKAYVDISVNWLDNLTVDNFLQYLNAEAAIIVTESGISIDSNALQL